MSHLSRGRVRALLAASIAVSALSVAPSAAFAGTSTKLLSCDLPIVGPAIVSAQIDAGIPAQVQAGTPISAAAIAVRLTSQRNADNVDVAGSWFRVAGATTIEGTGVIGATVRAAGFTRQLPVPLALPSTSVPAAPPLVLATSGTAPTFTLPQSGPARITLDAVSLNLTARFSNGVPITDFAAVQEYPDSDGLDTTFDVPCTLVDSADTTLATISVAPPAPFTATSTQQLSCDFPLAGQALVSAQIDTGFPAQVQAGTPITNAPIAVRLTSQLDAENQDVGYLFFEVFGPTSRVEGGGSATVTARAAGFSQSLPVPFALPSTPFPAQAPLLLTPSGTAPSFTLPQAGPARITLDAFSLNLTAISERTGAPITQLAAAQAAEGRYPDSDGLNTTFDAPCTLVNPADNGLATIDVTSPTIARNFAASGSVTMKTLTKAPFAVTGSFNSQLPPASGTFTSNVTFARATADLISLNGAPIKAAVQLQPLAPLTGTLSGTTGLTASVKVRVKIPSATLLGTDLALGASCQVKNPTVISLRSPGFRAASGGVVTGTFPIGDLSGCAALSGLVSPLTTSNSNAIVMNLSVPAAS